MGELTFAFETDRLRVFEAHVTPWVERGSSTVYLAFLKCPGAIQTVAQAIVTDDREKSVSLMPLYCQLVEVSVMFRGKGYGQELFLAIEGRLGSPMAAAAALQTGKSS